MKTIIWLLLKLLILLMIVFVVLKALDYYGVIEFDYGLDIFKKHKPSLVEGFKDQHTRFAFCQLGDIVGPDVVKIKVGKFDVHYHSDEFAVSEIKKYAKFCIKKEVGSQYEFDCCMQKVMYSDVDQY